MKVDFRVVSIPVRERDRAREVHHQRLSWRVDADIRHGDDFRGVQMTPAGSDLVSIAFGVGIPSATPASIDTARPSRPRWCTSVRSAGLWSTTVRPACSPRSVAARSERTRWSPALVRPVGRNRLHSSRGSGRPTSPIHPPDCMRPKRRREQPHTTPDARRAESGRLRTTMSCERFTHDHQSPLLERATLDCPRISLREPGQSGRQEVASMSLTDFGGLCTNAQVDRREPRGHQAAARMRCVFDGKGRLPGSGCAEGVGRVRVVRWARTVGNVDKRGGGGR